MSRYKIQLQPTLSEKKVRQLVDDFFSKEGFVADFKDEENVFRKGLGILTGPQYIKFEHDGKNVNIEAWIKFALLPGIYLGEMGLTGGFGAIPKKALKNKIEALLELIQQ